jgi:hypothetical protein
MAVDGQPITFGKIKEYCDEYFFSCLERWAYTKMWGMAHGGRGWADEPVEYVQVISILDSEQNRIEKEDMDKKMAASKAKPPSKK